MVRHVAANPVGRKHFAAHRDSCGGVTGVIALEGTLRSYVRSAGLKTEGRLYYAKVVCLDIDRKLLKSRSRPAFQRGSDLWKSARPKYCIGSQQQVKMAGIIAGLDPSTRVHVAARLKHSIATDDHKGAALQHGKLHWESLGSHSEGEASESLQNARAVLTGPLKTVLMRHRSEIYDTGWVLVPTPQQHL